MMGILTVGSVAIFGNPAYSQTKKREPQRIAAAPSSSTETVGSNAPSGNPETEAKYKVAVERFGRSDIAGALETLREMAASDPKMIPPRLVLAQWFARLNNPNAVRISLEKAVEESPEDPEAYILLAENALRQGEFAAADLLLEKGGAILEERGLPENPERQKNLTISLYKNRVMLFQNREAWGEMQKALGTIWKMEGETVETCRLIGVSYFQLGDVEKARQWFDRAKKISPETELPADAMIARLYLSKGDRENAKSSLDVALKNDPDSTPILNLSLSLAINENDLEKVKSLSDKLYASNPEDPATLRTCGIAALYQEDYPKAERFFNQAFQMEPANTDAANGLALALCEQNDPEKMKLALQHATSNLQKQGNSREYMATLGWVLYRSGNVDKALGILQQVAAGGQMNALTAYYLAEVLREKGDKESARNVLSASLNSPLPFTKRAAAERLAKQLP